MQIFIFQTILPHGDMPEKGRQETRKRLQTKQKKQDVKDAARAQLHDKKMLHDYGDNLG